MARVELTHPEKLLFPADGITKADLAAYYEEVAPALLAHVRDRPLSLQVFPRGIDAPGHFLKNVPAYFPDWVRRVELPKRDGTVTHVLATSADTLRMLTQHNAVTLHVPTARVNRLDRPDRLIVDLDPTGADDWDAVVAGARRLRELVAAAGLEPFAMTTGSRGLHVVAPLRRELGYGDVLDMGRALAAALVEEEPERFTTKFLKDDRGGRLFVDVLRNRPAQTAVAPYSVRARPGAPVATPIAWEELDGLSGSQAFTLRTIPARLADVGDPWEQIAAAAVSPRSAARRLVW